MYIFWSISKLGKLFYKQEAMGGGDIKLVMLFGAILFPVKILLMLYISFLLGSIIAIFLLITKIKKRRDYIPFGPILVLGGLLTIFLGDELLRIVFPFL